MRNFVSSFFLYFFAVLCFAGCSFFAASANKIDVYADLASEYYATFYENSDEDGDINNDIIYLDYYTTIGVSEEFSLWNTQLDTFTNQGKTISGWELIDPTNSSNVYASFNKAGIVSIQELAQNGYADQNNRFHFRAVWSDQYISFIYNANGGEGSMNSSIVPYSSNSFTFPKNTFTYDGYIFAGWSLDGMTTNYPEQTTIENDTEHNSFPLTDLLNSPYKTYDTFTGEYSITFYAMWKDCSFTINLISSNGELGKVSFENVNSVFSSSVEKNIEITTIDEEISIYAKLMKEDAYGVSPFKFRGWQIISHMGMESITTETLVDGSFVIFEAKIQNITDDMTIQANFDENNTTIYVRPLISTAFLSDNELSEINFSISSIASEYYALQNIYNSSPTIQDVSYGGKSIKTHEGRRLEIAINYNLENTKYRFVGFYATSILSDTQTVFQLTTANTYTGTYDGSYNYIFARFAPKTLNAKISATVPEINEVPGSLSGSSYYYDQHGIQTLDEQSGEEITLQVAEGTPIISLTGTAYAGFDVNNSNIFNGNDRFLLSTPVTTTLIGGENANLLLSLRFSPKNYVLSFNSEYGAVSQINVTYKKQIGSSLPEPHSVFASFICWTIEGIPIYFDTVWGYTDNKTAEANWTERYITIQTLSNGGTFTTDGTETLYTAIGQTSYYYEPKDNSTVLDIPNAPNMSIKIASRNDGSTFVGYSNLAEIESDAQLYIKFENGMFTYPKPWDIQTSNNSEIVYLYAIYIKTYNLEVTYRDGSTVNDKSFQVNVYRNDGTVDCDLNALLPLETIPNDSGCTAVGYLLENVADPTKILPNTITINENTTIFILYKNYITITFKDKNKEAITTDSKDYYKTSGGVVSAPTFTLISPPVLEGYTFSNWNTQEDGRGVRYTSATATFGISTQLFAIYSATTYELNFFVGENKVKTEYFTYDQIVDLRAYTANKSADDWHTYSFKCWKDGETNMLYADSIKITGDTNLYAEFNSHFRVTSENMMILGIIVAVIAVFILIGLLVRRTYKQTYL